MFGNFNNVMQDGQFSGEVGMMRELSFNVENLDVKKIKSSPVEDHNKFISADVNFVLGSFKLSSKGNMLEDKGQRQWKVTKCDKQLVSVHVAWGKIEWENSQMGCV